MKVIDSQLILNYLIGARIIGVGKTAICFLLTDGRVLKVYYNSYNKRYLFNKYDMFEHLKILNSINNDSYIGPSEIIKKDEVIIGYLYPYVNGKTLNYARNYLVLSEFSDNYFKIEEDTKRVSEKNFLLKDLHDRNILIGASFYIIDLDLGYIDLSLDSDEIFRYNMLEINKTIINSIFDVKPWEILEFNNNEINNLYNKSIYSIPQLFPELLAKIDEQCCSYKSTAPVLRKKISYHKDRNSYYRHF